MGLEKQHKEIIKIWIRLFKYLTLSAVKLAAETSRIMCRSISAETGRNVIRHAGYSSRVARQKPFISSQNQKKRLEFAKTHQLKTEVDNDDVQELLDSHNQELTIEELIEMHEQEQDIEELESLDPVCNKKIE
ncbi:transposable element Tcb2 transposase [Trichonephila clavipes]|nr:transposable element Tcb2 transposase [Trichonephila clavipes]